MPVFQLLYASGTVGAPSQADLDAILESSRRNNARLGITGMLLHANGAFIQVLEGPEAEVRRLAARISHDRRHRNYMVLVERHAPAAAFSEWAMGFKELDPARGNEAIFTTTRSALEGRIKAGDDRLMLDAVLAFAGRDFLSDR